jgi:hypothetical protein
MKIKIFIFCLIPLLALVGATLVLATNGGEEADEDVEEEEEYVCVPGGVSCSQSPPYRCNEFIVYKCANNLCGREGGDMEQGIKWYECVDWSCSDGCDSWSGTDVVGGPYGPDQIQSYGEVPEYQTCPPQYNEWSTNPPVPECLGSCYPAPEPKPLNDDYLLPKNTADGEGKYKLPINFGWEDNIEKEVIKEPNFCTVGSYEFNIPDPSLTEVVPNTQYDQLVTTSDAFYKLQCQLKSDSGYQWKVRACLDGDGEDCGDWSGSQNFNTSLAPEPISPYDSDWTGEELAENAFPVLKWCPIEEAGSYFLEVYREEGEGKKLLLSERTTTPLYDDDIGWQEIKKGFSYWWQVLWCPEIDTPTEECSPFSQLWGLISGEELLMATNLSPKDGSAVNLSTILAWEGARHAAAYWVNFQGNGLNENFRVPRVEEGKSNLPLKEIWEENLKLDTLYYWQVATCSKTECGDWSEIITLRTTGALPTNVKLEPSNESGEISFPFTISWDDMPGAASYAIKAPDINLSETLLKPEKILYFEPPYPQQGGTYAVSIKTCADEEGKVCGEATQTQFTVASLKPPVLTQPKTGEPESIPSIHAKWHEVFGANAYEHQLTYTTAEPEETAECKSLVGSVTKGTSPSPSATISALCAGQYSLQVRGCIDEACQKDPGLGQWSSPLTFAVKEGAVGGLIPCGRPANNPNTPWDDREPCEIKHLFLLIKVILDFLLFRLVPIALVVLALYSGIMFYLSLGGVKALTQVISLWKSVGLGLIITFFAWTMVNVFLKLIGYQIGIFGNWYELL